MFSKGVLCLFIFLLAEAVAYDNLALNQSSEQSSSNFGNVDTGSAKKGNDGDNNNNVNYDTNSCTHTTQHVEEAWWKVNLGFITWINEIKITYRDQFAARLAGFSIFVSNTSDFKNGVRCFKQSGPLPNVERTSYPCSALGQFITIYNDRFQNTTYPDGYNTGGAQLELCEVEVPGCKDQHYGQNCENNCFCKGLTCDYQTGKCDGDCQPGYTGEKCNKPCDPGYYGERCLSPCLNCGENKPCNQSGVCLGGCEVGFYLDDSKLCSNQCGKCNGTRCNWDGSCPQGCVDGYYSPDCATRCPNNCHNRCKQQSGKCLSCKNGYFDEHCDVTCPNYCLQGKCDISSGHCLGCEPGRYGYNCANECLHCGGNKTCNDIGFCLNGCEAGYLSDYSPGCRLKINDCKETSCNLTLSLAVGISNGLLLVVLGTIIAIIWTRRNRPQTRTRSHVYMQSVDENTSEHVYSDIQPEIQNAKAALGEELVDLNKRGVPQKGKVAGIKTYST